MKVKVLFPVKLLLACLQNLVVDLFISKIHFSCSLWLHMSTHTVCCAQYWFQTNISTWHVFFTCWGTYWKYQIPWIKGHYQFFVNWDLFWLISRSSRDFPKCKVPSEYVYLHLNISFEKKIDWFTSTRGVYGCLRTCYALKLFNSRQAFMLCLKDQAVSSWFTFARGVYSLITKNEALYKYLLKNKKLRHNKEVSIRQKYINTSCRSESRKIVWSYRQFIAACLDLNIITA